MTPSLPRQTRVVVSFASTRQSAAEKLTGNSPDCWVRVSATVDAGLSTIVDGLPARGAGFEAAFAEW
jgi:hypothetical protein